jgi:hypothetical protein
MAAVALRAGGGLRLGPLTGVEVALQLTGGALVATALAADEGRRVHGATAAVLMGALAILTGLSVTWSVNPADSWIEANRTLAYAATFAGGIALVRLAGERWAALVGATVVAAVVVCGYALLTKIFPGALNPGETYARLREPFGYWNAVGLMAALGVPGCLWLGARRSGHAALNALAYPALGVLVLTMLLAYSRGSLLAAGLGGALWFLVVPLRLRGFAVLATSTVAAVLVAAWAFAQDGLTKDRIDLGLRASAGHELGVALAAMLIGLLLAGLAIGFVTARGSLPAHTRHRAGVAVLAALALVPLVVVGALAVSDRGLGGSVSHGWKQLTDPRASTPPNEPGRLTAVGSVRARYWHQALKIFDARPLLGAGAGGYATARPRFREDTLDVRHAHGYAVQTLADLGLIGMAVSLALLAAWLACAARTTGLNRAGLQAPYGTERIGLLTLAAVVVVFGVHSFIDWTWFVPGPAVIALLCAGWVAGRGPVPGLEGGGAPGRSRPLGAALGEWASPAALADRVRREPRLVGVPVVALAALAASWATYQPLRAAHAGEHALAALEGGHVAKARAAAAHARDINPLSVEPLFDLAAIEGAARRPAAARAALEQAVSLQPSNAETWLRLAEFDLDAGRLRPALDDISHALALDPRSPVGIQTFLQISRGLSAGAGRPGRGAETR